MDSIHQLFENQVARTPLDVAVAWGDCHLSYAELNAQSNQVAGYVLDRGGCPEARVAICTKRSPRMITAILGVLKAGGVYIPVDTTYPLERIEFLLKDAAPHLVLTGPEMRTHLAALDMNIVDLDAEWTEVEKYSRENPPETASEQNGGYIIYTSGSSGRPKGVLVTRGGMSNLAAAQQQIFALQSADATLQFSSPSFDAAVWELLMALLSGARLVLPTEGNLMGGDLADFIESAKVTIATLPPSVLATLPPRELPNLKILVVAGEACGPDLVEKWGKGRRMFNAYGPTETTVCATVSLPLTEQSGCPIGQPIANTEIYLLTEGMDLVPAGSTAELYVGGPSLARGYVNSPALTAECFVPHPFSPQPGARLYRTGDLGRWRANATLEFAGRRDDQVKIRGYRVEMGEIESALREHPAVRNAAALLREDEAGESRLVAYVEAHGQSPGASTLREHLGQKLPEYMIPSLFIFLENLPLTTSGKVDRRRLPTPSKDRPELDRPYVAPRTEVEAVLARIWIELLRVDRVGVHDTFYELGGHSLLLPPLTWKIAEEFEVEISLRDLLGSLTIEEMTVLIVKQQMAAQNISDARSLIRELGQMSLADARRSLGSETSQLKP